MASCPWFPYDPVYSDTDCRLWIHSDQVGHYTNYQGGPKPSERFCITEYPDFIVLLDYWCSRAKWIHRKCQEAGHLWGSIFCGGPGLMMIISGHGGDTFCIAGPLWGESTSYQRYPFMMGQFWCLLSCFPEQAVELKHNWVAHLLRCHGAHATSLMLSGWLLEFGNK